MPEVRNDVSLPSELFNAHRGTVEHLKPLTLLFTIAAEKLSGAGERLFNLRADSGENFILKTADVAGVPSILIEACFDYRNVPLVLSCPIEWLGASCKVVVHYSGPNFDFFVDGVLVDEEWSTGIPVSSGEAHEPVVNGDLLRLVRGWAQALNDREIGFLGGTGMVRRQREQNINL